MVGSVAPNGRRGQRQDCAIRRELWWVRRKTTKAEERAHAAEGSCRSRTLPWVRIFQGSSGSAVGSKWLSV